MHSWKVTRPHLGVIAHTQQYERATEHPEDQLTKRVSARRELSGRVGSPSLISCSTKRCSSLRTRDVRTSPAWDASSTLGDGMAREVLGRQHLEDT